jgi:transposase-like protein
MNCIHCQSEAIVKNGTKTLKTGQVLQQYLCNTCGRRFNERSGTPMARLRAPVATVEMALNARHEGLGVRAAARVVGTSPSNITTWEERLSSHLPAWSPPAPEANPVGVLYRAHLRSLELSGNLERTLLYCNPHGLFQ